MLDVDIHPDEGVNGFVSIAALERQHGALPDTLTSATPRGGFHLFFKWHPGIRNNADGKLGAHLDIRGDGGYVIVPPSMRWDRKIYGWRENCPAEPAEAPTWLIELLTTPAAAPAPSQHQRQLSQQRQRLRLRCPRPRNRCRRQRTGRATQSYPQSRELQFASACRRGRINRNRGARPPGRRGNSMRPH